MGLSRLYNIENIYVRITNYYETFVAVPTIHRDRVSVVACGQKVRLSLPSQRGGTPLKHRENLEKGWGDQM